jgi:hypothetical protein
MRMLPFLLLAAGCFQTVIRPPGTQVGPVTQDRQFFTIGGLVPLSSPSGVECGSSGLAWAESEMDVVDVLIYIGLSVAGGIIGGAACPGKDGGSADDTRNYASCVAGTAGLLPFFISTRTVKYACAGAGPPALPPVTGSR